MVKMIVERGQPSLIYPRFASLISLQVCFSPSTLSCVFLAALPAHSNLPFDGQKIGQAAYLRIGDESVCLLNKEQLCYFNWWSWGSGDVDSSAACSGRFIRVRGLTGTHVCGLRNVGAILAPVCLTHHFAGIKCYATCPTRRLLLFRPFESAYRAVCDSSTPGVRSVLDPCPAFAVTVVILVFIALFARGSLLLGVFNIRIGQWHRGVMCETSIS